jgi:hypothetical protein
MFRAFGRPEHEIRVNNLIFAAQSEDELAQLLLALYKEGIPIPTKKPSDLL